MDFKKKFASFTSAVVLGATALLTSAITMSGALVTFETADGTAVSSALGTAISNLWAGFTFLLPYIGMVLGIAIVIGGVFALVNKIRSH